MAMWVAAGISTPTSMTLVDTTRRCLHWRKTCQGCIGLFLLRVATNRVEQTSLANFSLIVAYIFSALFGPVFFRAATIKISPCGCSRAACSQRSKRVDENRCRVVAISWRLWPYQAVVARGFRPIATSPIDQGPTSVVASRSSIDDAAGRYQCGQTDDFVARPNLCSSSQILRPSRGAWLATVNRA